MGSSPYARLWTRVAAALIAMAATSARASSPEAPRQLKYPAKKTQRARIEAGELPDPPPLYTRAIHRITFKWDKRAPSILTVNTLDLAKPESTERWAGRFALELFERGVLIERVRFNFPMLGALPSGTSMASAIDANMVSTAEVSFPSTTRGDMLALRDRATGQRWQLAWPPRVEAIRGLPDVAHPATR